MLHNKLRRLPIAALALIFAPLAVAPSLAHEHKGAPEVFVDGELAIVHIDHANPALDTTVYHLVQEKAGNP